MTQGQTMQAEISQKLLNSLKADHKAGRIAAPLEVRDQSLKGFILRVQPSGAMSYIVQLARAKRVTFGDAAIMTPTQARLKAKTALGAVAEGRDPRAALRMDQEARVPTLAEFIEGDYAAWAKANRRSAAGTLARIRRFFPDFADVPINQISALAVETWRRARLHSGVTMATVNRDLVALKAALSRALDWEKIDRHPLAKVKPGKVDTVGVIRFLSPAEEAVLRAALKARDDEARAARDRGNAWRAQRHLEAMPSAGCYADHLTPMVLLSLNTGLRKGELFNLRWTEVDLDRATLTVRGDGAKSGKTRHIPLNSEAVTALRTWREQQPSNGLVFTGRTGGRFDNVRKAWVALLTDAGIADFRWHDMRHHFASRLVMAGVDLNTVRDLLGHADITMTLRYAHLSADHKAAAVARLLEF